MEIEKIIQEIKPTVIGWIYQAADREIMKVTRAGVADIPRLWKCSHCNWLNFGDHFSCRFCGKAKIK